MKKLLSKGIGMVLSLVCMSICVFPNYIAQAAETTDKVEVDAFTPSVDSTWGDLYQHFDPQGYDAFTDSEKRLYHSILLKEIAETSEENMNTVMTESGVDILGNKDFENVVSLSGYLYSNDNTNRAININGLLSLVMGLASTKDSIEYTTAFASTITCPRLAISMSIYDVKDGKYVGFNRGYDDNVKIFTLDDTFDGLKSKTEYTVQAVGTVTPPEGYISSGPLVTLDNKKTK